MKKPDNQPHQLSYNLRPYQDELLQLSELAGIHADPNVLKIIVELLNMQVPPHAIYNMLKTIRRSSRTRRSGPQIPSHLSNSSS